MRMIIGVRAIVHIVRRVVQELSMDNTEVAMKLRLMRMAAYAASA